MMQAGFLCLESGLVRSKNSINVAAKNIADFIVSSTIFWAVGYAIMFGSSVNGWFGSSGFFFGEEASGHNIAIFLFQMMFCGTAATLVSGAVAERMSFFGYLIVTITITLLVYPIVGHWAWGGIIEGSPVGWLELSGFVDFAGSTVVHSVGGWVALAAILIIGPRSGRYDLDQKIPGSNVPLATLGCLLLWFGWFGFNGGSTLAWSDAVPGILLHTCLAAFWGGIASTVMVFTREGYCDVQKIINGILGGLVAITANCHIVSPLSAAFIGGIGGLIVYWGEHLLDHFKIDDAVGVIPVHLFAGIWGTLAVALFGKTELLDNGLTRLQQLTAQVEGIVAIGCYSFFISLVVLALINRFRPLRVTLEMEIRGLNVAEHRVSTEVFELLSAMQQHQQRSEFSEQVPEEPFTEVGQIAHQYNRVIEKVNEEIRQRDEAFTAFRQSEYRKGAILEAAMDCIVSVNGRAEILEFNPAAEQCFGIGKRKLQGKNFFNMFMSGNVRNIALESLSQGFTLGDGLVLRRRNITELNRANGETFPAEVVITQTSDMGDSNQEYTLHVRDITQQIKLQERLRMLAYKDSLTGLYNRNYFMEYLNKRIRFHRTNPGAVILMFLDLDQFKKINDTLGHKAGDDLLHQVAQRLSKLIRGVDLIGRWGGDEFVIVMSGDINLKSATKRAEDILKKLAQPLDISGHSLTVLTSIGIAISPNGSINGDKLLQHADMAMYKAKQGGRNTFRIFSEDMEETAHQQFRLEFALPNAISQGQLFLQYQPKVHCESSDILGFEALLRWEHPEQGLIPPGEFIPVIEDSSLIVQVGEWVVEEAFRQLAHWKKQGLKLLPVAINISGRHLHTPGLVDFIQIQSHKYHIPTSLIELEITEGVLTGNTEESIAAMAALKESGIKLSIDDFGTGYSSLSYLKRFPIDVLKIDRAFISECASNPEDAAICSAIITVGRNIGLQTIAEGVETREQLDFLTSHGCDAYQGFYYSRALPAAEIPALLAGSVAINF